MIHLENICKQYTNHNHTVHAIDNVSFSVAVNERVGIAGGQWFWVKVHSQINCPARKLTSGTF